MAETTIKGPLTFTGSSGVDIATYESSFVQIQSGQGAGYLTLDGSGKLRQQFGDGSRFVYRDGTPTYSADQFAKCKISGLTNNSGSVGVVVRCSADTNTNADFYLVLVNSGASPKATELYKVANGGVTALDTRTSVAWADGDELKISAVTNGANCDLAIYQNGGTALYTISDTTSPLATGKPGLFMQGAASNQVFMDDWEAGDVTAAPAGPVISTPVQTLTGTTRTTAGATIDSGGTTGTLYALGRTGGSAASAATIKATGQSNATSGTGAKTVPATVIAAGSATQHVDLVYNDATNGDSNVVTVGPFTTASALSFSGTIPTQTVTSGAVVDLDLSSYWAGTGFGSLAWSSIGASIAGASSGLNLNTATGHITGTAGAAQTISGVQLRKSDSGLAVSSADSGTFTIAISAAAATKIDLTIAAAAGLTGIRWSVQSAAALAGSITTIASGSAESFDGSGNISLDITGLSVPVGAYRYVTLTQSNGDPAQSPAPFGWHGPAIAS